MAGGGDAMTSTSWLPLVEEYLSVRRGLGFALETPAFLLRDFARYVSSKPGQSTLVAAKVPIRTPSPTQHLASDR